MFNPSHHFISTFTRPRRFVGAWVALCALLNSMAYGVTEVPRSFDELVQLADLVIVGTVREVRSGYANNGLDQDNIVSQVTFQDLDVVKGRIDVPTYDLQVPGGVVDRFAQTYPGIPLFIPGQRYVLFIRGNHRDFFPVVGISQGVFRVLMDPQGKQVVVRDDLATEAALAHSLSQTMQEATTLDNFLLQIRDRLSATGGASP